MLEYWYIERGLLIASFFLKARLVNYTVEPRFNEVAGDRLNLFVKWRVRYIENLDITNVRGKDQNVRYIEVIVNDWFLTQVTSVEILQCQCLWQIISRWLKVTVFLRYGLNWGLYLLTVDLFIVYLPSRVDIVLRYIEVDFTFGLPEYVRYIEEFFLGLYTNWVYTPSPPPTPSPLAQGLDPSLH